MKHTIYSGMMNGLSIDRCTRDGEYNMIKHWHPEFEIQYFISGRRYFFIEDQTFALKPGSMVLVNSGQVHNTFSDKYIYHDRVLLLFENEKFTDQLSPFGINLEDFFAKNWGDIQIPKSDQEFVAQLFADLAQEVNDKHFIFQAAAGLKMAELMVYLMRLKYSGSMEEIPKKTRAEGNEVVDQLTQYIRENYATVGSLDELARIFYLDKFYLSRLFKKNTGHTITEFINIQKIQKAQKLLEDTEDSIAEIGKAVGYDNMTYFNRVFKKYIETSPLQYRKKQIAYKTSLREKNNY